jgi:4-amino-4-deoxy-L-arabinose transferase-like glycosyltransferase
VPFFFAILPATRSITSASRLRDAVLVTAAALTVLLVNLGGPPLFDDDETRNAGCSLAMLDSGDWVVPTFNGELRVHKPPLVNWVQMAGISIAGRNELGARIGSACVTTLTCLITWKIGCLIFSPAVGLLGGLVMAGCIWTAVGGRAATPDAPLVLATTTGLWLLAGGLDPITGRLRLNSGRAAALGLTSGLAILAKGPVGFVVPAGATLLFACWQAMSPNDTAPHQNWRQRATQRLLDLRPLTILTATTATALPWYVWVGLRTDWEWPRRFLLEHNLERFATPLEGHSGSIAYYPLILLIGLFPWSIASLLTVTHAVRKCWPQRHEASRAGHLLLVMWAVSWIGFFTVAGTKLPGYIWPAYPALAALAGAFWHEWSLEQHRSDRWMPVAWLSLITVGFAFAAAGPLAVSRSLPEQSASSGIWFLAAGILTALCGGIGWILQAELVPGSRRLIPVALAAVGVGASTLLATAASRAFSPLGPRELIASLPVDAKVAVTAWGSPSGVFYATARHGASNVARLDEPEQILSHIATHPEAYLLVDPRFADPMLDQLPHSHRVLETTASMPGGKSLMLIGPSLPMPQGPRPNQEATAQNGLSIEQLRRLTAAGDRTL